MKSSTIAGYAGSSSVSKSYNGNSNTGKNHTEKSSANKENAKNKKKHRPTRSELNKQAWELKRQKKRRGNPPGSRFNIGMAERVTRNEVTERDPRIGSKQAIPLISAAEHSLAPITSVTDKKQATTLSMQQELDLLENDPRLDALLDRLEDGKILSDADQHWLDSKLARIDQLMTQLNIGDQPDSSPKQQAEKTEDIMRLLRANY